VVETLLYFAIALVVLAVVFGVVVWVARYMGAPEILVKGLIAIGVLFALILFVRAFLYHDGPAFHVFLGNGTPALRS
jgi:hypothetical protein